MVAPVHEDGRSDADLGMPVIAATAISAASMLVFGGWAFLMPDAFAEFIGYPPYNEHLIHDAGAFQIGIGVAVALALIVRDSILATLSGFVVASGLHTWSHYMDRPLGGHDSDVPILGLFTIIGIFGIYADFRGRKS